MNARYGALATYSGTGKGIFVAVPVYAIVVIALFTRLRAVLACFHKHWPFSALALLSLASFAWSQFPIRSLEFSLLLTLDTLFAFYFCLRFSQDGQMRLLLIVGWMCLLFSIALSLFFPKFGMDYTEGVAGNWRGMYDHKNTCAMMTTFLLSPALFVKTGSLLGSVGRIIYVFLSVALIVMTQSRTGWILVFCLFICAGILRLLTSLSGRDRYVALAIGPPVVLSAVIVLGSYTRDIAFLIGKDPTMSGRTVIWSLLIKPILKRPLLGYGYSAFWGNLQGESGAAFQGTTWIPLQAHNGYIEVLLSLGIVGLGLVLYSIIVAIRNVVVCVHDGDSIYHEWAACIVVLMMVVSLDEGALTSSSNIIWIMYILACVGLSQGSRDIRWRGLHELSR